MRLPGPPVELAAAPRLRGLWLSVLAPGEQVSMDHQPTSRACPRPAASWQKRSESLTAPDRPVLGGLAALTFLLAFFPPFFFFFFPTGREAGDGPSAARLVPLRLPAASRAINWCSLSRAGPALWLRAEGTGGSLALPATSPIPGGV